MVVSQKIAEVRSPKTTLIINIITLKVDNAQPITILFIIQEGLMITISISKIFFIYRSSLSRDNYKISIDHFNNYTKNERIVRYV